MDPYDVLGLTFEAAMEKCNKLGISPTIKETASLRGPLVEEGTLRVVNQIMEGDSLTLILCKIPDIKGVVCHTK